MSLQKKQYPNNTCTHAQNHLAFLIYLLDFTSQGDPHNDFDKEM